MAYIYIDKETRKARIFGSISSLSKNTGIKKDNLYTFFSREKRTEVENGKYRIVKTAIERS